MGRPLGSRNRSPSKHSLLHWQMTLVENLPTQRPAPRHRFTVRVSNGKRLWSGSGDTPLEAQIDAERLMPIRPWLYVTPA